MIGLEFNAAALRDRKLIGTILSVAFVGKILGGYWGGRLAGLTNDESLAVGIGLNGRGVMELVVASIALSSGFIGERLFTALVLMGLVTTFVTPSLLRKVFSEGLCGGLIPKKERPV